MLLDHSIQTLLKKSSKQLEVISDSAYLDAELLLAHCLDKNKTYLHTWPENKLNKKQLDCFFALIKKRLTDYPVAYLIGKKPFWSFELMVTPDVLIPRPETELLVETALEKIKHIKKPNVLDLGTGSGAIALAIASERPDSMITATDNSQSALQIAKINADKLGLNKQVSFVESHWFDNLDKQTEDHFDLIVSNPPYIDPEDYHLQGTIRYEPQQALIADSKGMLDIEKIIQKSHPFLKKSGFLILEHGFDQSEKTLALLSANHFTENKSYRDLNNNWRISLGCKN